MTTGKKLKKQAWIPMPMPYSIIKRVEYLAAQERRYRNSGEWISRKCNNEIFADGTEGDDEEPLIEKEVVQPDIPANLSEVKL